MAIRSRRCSLCVCSLGISGLSAAQPCAPQLLGETPIPLVPVDLVVRGDLAYALGANRLAILDLSNPGMPVLRGEAALPAGNGAREASLAGNILAVAANGSFVLIDVADPDNPAVLSEEATPSRATGIDTVNQIAYVADRVCCVIAYDISNPLEPAVLWTDDRGIWGYERVAFDGSIGYVQTSDNPRAVIVRDYSSGPSAANISYFTVVEQLDLIQLDGSILHATSDDRYLSVHYSDLESPAMLDESRTTSGAAIRHMAAHTPRVTLALGSEGIEIIDVRNPEAHALVAWLPVAGGTSCVAEGDGFLVVLTGDSRLVTLDLTGCADCPADTNADGLLTEADFAAWVHAFNNSYPAADQNSDGAVTPADFSAWIANYNAGC